MKIGAGSYSFPWHVSHAPNFGPIALYEAARVARAEVVQFCENCALAGNSIAEIVNRATFDGVTLETGARGLSTTTVESQIEVCQAIGARWFRMVIDTAEDEPSLSEISRRLREVTPRLRESGVRVAIENHDRLRATDLVKLVEEFGQDTVAVCLDTANSLGAFEGYHETVGILAPHSVCLHAKDVQIRRYPDQLGFTVHGCPVGDGQIDWPWVLAQMNPEHMPNVIVEFWLRDTGDIAENLRLEVEWTRNSLAHLKDFNR